MAMSETSSDSKLSPGADVPWRGLPEGVIATCLSCLVALGVGGFFLYDGVHIMLDGSASAGLPLMTFVKAVLAVGVAGFLFFVRADVPGMLRARQRIQEHPEEVVWTFEKVTTSRNGTSRCLSVGLVNGKIVEWALAAPLIEQPRIRGWIEQNLPHATMGYTDELRARFNSSPRSLLRFQPGTRAS